jgi:DNA-binding transcriptional LysR family regulator
LEEDVGITLFERHARGLRPTQQGQVLIEHARRVLAQLDMARDEMAVLRLGGSGLVRIGTSGASAADTVPLAVIDLLAQAPQTRVRLVEGTMDLLLEQLARGELDIVVGRSMPESSDVGVRAETLYLEPIHLVARPKHPLVGRGDLEWRDLLGYRWLMWPRGTPIRTALEHALGQAGQQMPADCVESNSVTLNLTLLNHSDLIGVASHRAAIRFSQLNAMRVLDVQLSAFGSVSAYWRSREEARSAVALCLRCIRKTAARSGAEARP